MRETRLFLFRADSSIVPADRQTLGTLNLNFTNDELVASHGEGWLPVSHTVSVLDDGDLLVSVLMDREVQLPDDSSQI
jgi:CHASE1-domain containing sensor protein